MWSIGIKTGDSPLRVRTPAGHTNPVIAAPSVTDVQASFVADPFMIPHEGAWHMFFEVMPALSRRGEIGLAFSHDGFAWSYRQIVLREAFHLSYPYVFELKGAIYLAPEARQSGSVHIYRSQRFPTVWTPYARLANIGGADPSFFEYGNRLWMFICPDHFHSLRLYSAREIQGPWSEHPQSPVVHNDCGRARPAGRVIVHEGRIFRFAQDCRAGYGTLVRAFEITELTADHYAETEACESPVLQPSGKGWDGALTHHIDAHLVGPNQWIACVDGHPVTHSGEPAETPSH